MQKRSLTLMRKVDSNIESILSQFLKIIELSSILDKSQGALLVESLQIESNSSTIIRLIEELLSITRNLKESWILGQIPLINTDESKIMNGLDVKMNKLLDLVLDPNDDDLVSYGDEIKLKQEIKHENDTVIKEEIDIADTTDTTDTKEIKQENDIENDIEMKSD